MTDSPSFTFLVLLFAVGLMTVLPVTEACADRNGGKYEREHGKYKKRYRTKKNRHRDVYRQRQSHKILPFKEILKKIRARIHGEIIETEFEMEDGIPIYEFKYIDKNGHVLEMEVDARTGRVLKVERD